MTISFYSTYFHWLWRASRTLYSSIFDRIGSPTRGRVSLSIVKTSQRRIGVARRVARATSTLQNLCPDAPVFGNLEMDSHADTCVLGKNFVQLHSTGRECDVFPYTDEYDGIKGVPIVTGGTAWTCQKSGETFVLVVNEGLWMPDQVPHSLVNPNQLRSFGVTVQDNPFGGPMDIQDPEKKNTNKASEKS